MKLQNSVAVEEKIEANRSNFVPVAKNASILFFAVHSLPALDPMYQYSLTWF